MNHYAPPGASCTINGGTFQSINVNYGASLTINGGNLHAVNDNYSASIMITSNAHVAGGMSLYGTRAGVSSLGDHSVNGPGILIPGARTKTFLGNK